MDNPFRYHMDSGIYGDKFRFFGVLVGAEGGSRGVAGAAELLSDGVRPREGVWVVVGAGPDVSAAVGGDVHCCVHGNGWLWASVARDSGIYHLAVFCDILALLVGWMQHLLVQYCLLRTLHKKLPF